MSNDLIWALTFTILMAFNVSVVVNSKPYQNLLKKYGFMYKPFSCPMCFTFWITIIFGVLSVNPYFILVAGLGAYLASEIDKKINTF